MRDHLYAHTGLRGLAALMVVPLHMHTEQFLGEDLTRNFCFSGRFS
jgi:peptidoglycan/LPS O-acetylase OafA/YrhL